MSTKPDWKTKPHERKRMTLQQENEQLKKRIDMLAYERDEYRHQATHFREDRDKLAINKDRYAVLRTKDVMVLDGEPKYLKGKTSTSTATRRTASSGVRVLEAQV